MVIQEPRLTKRAPDAGDSAHIPSSFPRLSIFLAGRLRRPRPSAGNGKPLARPLHNKRLISCRKQSNVNFVVGVTGDKNYACQQ